MELTRCRRCAALQPNDWKAGDLCVGCGAAVRLDARCPACSSWSPEGKFCRGCGCELPPSERYGAARMLTAAGVDRFSLGVRLRELDPAQLETLSAQYASQWAIASRRVDEARWCESFLLQHGFAADLEDSLAARLPLPAAAITELAQGPQGPFEQRPERLEASLATSPLPLCRTLAGLALLRSGRPSPGAIQAAVDALEEKGPLALEAALALSGWRTGKDTRDLDRRRIAKIAEPALANPTLRSQAAVACAWPRVPSYGARDPEAELGELLPALRDGLSDRDTDLRFTCAWLLQDDVQLGAALDTPDSDGEAMRRAARRALARAGSARIRPILAEGPEDARRDVLAGLLWPCGLETLAALLQGARSAATRTDALDRVRRCPAARYADDARNELGRWVREQAGELEAGQLLEVLAWASEAAGTPRLGGDGEDLLQAAEGALTRLEPGARSAIARQANFRRWLQLVGARAAPLLSRWIAEGTAGDEALESVFTAHGALQRDRPDDRIADLLLELWERAAPPRGELATALQRRTRSSRGISGRELILDRFWQRFRDRPEERRAILVALQPWRQELFELRDREPAERSLHGTDAAAFVRIYGTADPCSLPETVEHAFGLAEPEARAALVDAAFDVGGANVASEPVAAALAVAHLSALVVNGYRSSHAAEELRDAVERLRARYPDFAAAVRPSGEGAVGRALEQVDLELRLAAEAEARAAPPKPVPAPPVAPRSPTPPRGEPSPASAKPANAGPPAPSQPPPYFPKPVPPLEPLDSQAVLPGQPLATLLDYAGFLKALGSGGNAIQLLQARGMDPARWTACSQAWGRLLTSRPELAGRFGALLQMEWR